MDAAILVANQFESFAELSELAVAWNADFRQISAEQSCSEITQAKIGSILISNGYFGCHVTQRGGTPPGMRTFAMLTPDSSPMMWFGHYVDHNVLLVFPAHGDIDVHSRPGFKVQTFSVPEETLSRLTGCIGEHELQEVLDSNEKVLKFGSSRLDQMRVLLKQALESIQTNYSQSEIANLSSGFEEDILSQLQSLLVGSRKGPRAVGVQPNRIITDALHHIDEKGDVPLTLADLTTITGCTERTLRNHFKQWLDMSPKAYLKGKRLAAVHRDLWYAGPSSKSVSDIAYQRGFWHLGQFAADYKDLFGELPSTTLKRSF